ncbi:MAG: DUF1585 domain-containing protein, partial [Planctomycetaceae bacterium]|nr:DUF1585 domain-containing protein [Planctomycetaceae bacterium]
DGKVFHDVTECQTILAAQSNKLLTNLARQLMTYATGRQLRFRQREELARVVQLTARQGGGLRTLIHEIVGSPLFHGGADHISCPANIRTSFPTSTPNSQPAARMLMTSVLPPLSGPPVRRPTIETNTSFEAAADFTGETLQAVLRVTGLFAEERAGAFRSAVDQVPAARLLKLNPAEAAAVIEVDLTRDPFRGANEEQTVERLNQQLRQASNHTLGVRRPGERPFAELRRLELNVSGLDCAACCLAAHEILTRQDGVEQAEVSFRDSRAIVWYDTDLVSPEQLVEELTKRGVPVKRD